MKSIALKTVALLAVVLSIYSFSVSNTESSKVSFKDFLNIFEKKSLPYGFTLEQLTPKDGKNSVVGSTVQIDEKFGKIFPENLKPAKFSRMGPTYYYAEALVAETDKYYLVSYSSTRGRSSSGRSFYLMTFTKDGEVIDKRLFALLGYSSLSTGNINQAGELVMDNYTLRYPMKDGIMDYTQNPSAVLNDSQAFILSSNGKFEDAVVQTESQQMTQKEKDLWDY